MTEHQYSRFEATDDSSQPAVDVWRKEIHARVNGYRTRRGRRVEGAFSMRFPFPPSEPVEPAVLPADSEGRLAEEPGGPAEIVAEKGIVELNDETDRLPVEVAVSSNPSVDTAEELPPPPVPDPEIFEPSPPPETLTVASQPVPLARPKPKRKVIAFPRQVEVPQDLQRLAEPVVSEQPRILDVPEELEAFTTTPFLDGLQFEASPQPSAATRSESVVLPVSPAGISRRIRSALLDCIVVAVAGGIFGAIVHKMLPALAFTKPVRLTAMVAGTLLWSVYQYLFVVYGQGTLGAKLTGLRLSTFKGRAPKLGQRRVRILGLYLSTFSLVMGLLWILVDTDTLCWHDRISRTYWINRN